MTSRISRLFMDQQVADVKRNLIQKLLKDIFADLQMLEDVYDTQLLSKPLCRHA